MKQIILKNIHNEKLVGILHGKLEGRLVIICHGLRGNKKNSYLLFLAKALEKEGIPSFRFDFAGNGESEGEFSEATYHKEVEDLIAVMDYFEEQSNIHQFLLVGHSMGGGVVKVVAARDKRVEGMVSLAGVSRADQYKKRYAEVYAEVVKTGQSNLKPGKEGTQFPVTKAFFDSADRINILKAAKKISCPVLIVHSVDDDRVPVVEAAEFYEALPEKKRSTFIELSGMNHVFNEQLKTKEEAFEEMVAAVLPWIKALF